MFLHTDSKDSDQTVILLVLSCFQMQPSLHVPKNIVLHERKLGFVCIKIYVSSFLAIYCQVFRGGSRIFGSGIQICWGSLILSIHPISRDIWHKNKTIFSQSGVWMNQPKTLWICYWCSFTEIQLKGTGEYINEPPHEKTNKMTVRPAKTQISLGICLVWSESLLCTQWVAKDPSFLHADREDSDQTGRMSRLIWVFHGRTCHFVGFVMRRLNWCMSNFV